MQKKWTTNSPLLHYSLDEIDGWFLLTFFCSHPRLYWLHVVSEVRPISVSWNERVNICGQNVLSLPLLTTRQHLVSSSFFAWYRTSQESHTWVDHWLLSLDQFPCHQSDVVSKKKKKSVSEKERRTVKAGNNKTHQGPGQTFQEST